MRKVLSVLLSVMMICTIITPFSALAETEKPTITIENVSDTAGATVEIDVSIKNNPGIMGATLKLTYDAGLTLVDATSGDAFSALVLTKPGKLTSPCTFVWDGQEITSEDVKDGKILTLKFKISDSAVAGDEYEIKFENNGIQDMNVNSVDVAIEKGKVSVVDYLPGDLNGDGTVNSGDIILLRRHVAGGYEQKINEAACDVNNDGNKNSGDIILVRRYVAGGYGVVLKPSGPQCSHELTETSYNAPSCTEAGNIRYWSCSKCKKLFSDANGTSVISQSSTIISATGHTTVIDPAVEATYDSTGLTEGKHCSVCSEVLVAQTVIPKLEKDEYSIKYYIDKDDEYLQSIVIENPNPTSYSKEDGLVLEDLVVEGYNFVGWYTAQSAGERVSKIETGETGNRTLYARWEKVEYTISFYSPIVEKETIKRTIDQEVFITDPKEMNEYKFMGWTDANGNIVTSVKAGTGNIKLYANWVSYRNQTISNDYKKDSPIIVEDEKNQQYFFVYYIGKLVNVPLYTIKDFGNTTSGIIRHESITTTSSISKTTANSITKAVVDSTTNSATWTLSKDWNTLVANTQDFSESELKENNILISDGTISSEGTTTNTGTVKDTGTLTKNNTTTKDLTTTKKGNSAELGAEIAIGTDAWPVNVDLSGSYEQHKDTTEEDGKIKDKGKDKYNLTHTNNLTSAMSSTENSHNETVSETISKNTQKNWGFSVSESIGVGESSTEATESTISNSNSYSTSFSYNTTETTTTVKEFSTENAKPGWHRLVRAGTVHVFAVVGFDIPTRTYYNYAFSALDDEQYDFYDYSAHNGEYNDYETGVLPFEVPIDVHKYVSDRMYATVGLTVDAETGIVDSYEGEDEYVNIPDYYCIDNEDGTYSAVKITGIASGAFSGNENVKEIRLSNYITSIPDSAFEGCSSLEYVITPGVTKIGDDAFKGCTSLGEFTIPSDVTEVGTDAFEGVSKINAVASNAEVAQAVAASGAENIVLDISEADMTDTALEVGEITSFELLGKNKEYKGLSVKSDAATTVINGVNFADCTAIPMELSSENVTLNRVTANTQGFALVMSADSTDVKLNQNVSLISSLGNAVLCKDVNFASLNSGVVGKMTLSGDMLVAGDTVSGENKVNFSSGEIKYITDDEFESYRTSCPVTFDANGGSVDTTTKSVTFNTAIGELPTPTYGDYTFLGWYTEKNGGTEITADTVVTSAGGITAYAKWNNWDGTSTEPAYDAATKTYTITNGSELAWISDVTNGVITSGTNFPDYISFSGYTIELANDIYFNDTSDWENWATTAPENEWKPIGFSESMRFAGTFNGVSYDIYGLYYNNETTDYVGLFGYIRGADIIGLAINKTYLHGRNYVGGVAGYSINSCFDNCNNKGTIHGTGENVGGIVGYSESYLNDTHVYLKNCSNKGNIKASRCVGGIGGTVFTGTNGDNAICNSYNTGDIRASNSAMMGSVAGGIVGVTNGGVYQCFNKGEIIIGAVYEGGIIGKVCAQSEIQFYSVKVEKCYNMGSLSGGMASTSGGIIGGATSLAPDEDTIVIFNCYNTGAANYAISGEAEYSASYFHATQGRLNIPVSSVNVSRSESKLLDLTNYYNSGEGWKINSNINGGYPYLECFEEVHKEIDGET